MAFLTEDQAALKWCPKSPADADSGGCIASDCMAWRSGPDVFRETPGGCERIPRGYCGAFGKPS